MAKKLIILFVFIFLVFQVVDTQIHEMTHQDIYKSFGIDSTIKNHILSGKTIVTDDSQQTYLNLPYDTRLTIKKLHMELEIVSYQTQIIIGLAILLMFILILIGDKVTTRKNG